MAKKDTGKAPRPKRDPNKPLPKLPRRKSLIPRVLVGAILVLGGVWFGSYASEVGQAPWHWSGAQWRGFLTFSRQQVSEAGHQVANVDWSALKSRITSKTRALWNGVPALEKKLTATLAKLRAQRAAKAAGKDAGKAKAAGKAGKAGAKAAAQIPPEEANEVEQGCEALRKAIHHYQHSMNDQGELRKAQKLFQTAQDHLQKAYALAKGFPAQQQEIEGYLTQCNVYLEDCSKREIMK